MMHPLRACALIAALALTGPVHAADPYVVDSSVVYESDCDSGYALHRIKSRFAYAEHRTWRRGFVIDRIDNPRPSNHPYAEPGLIQRDYCMAEATMTNGDIRTVYFTIEHGVGFAGVGRSVDFCVLGLDPWHVHDGSCRTVR